MMAYQPRLPEHANLLVDKSVGMSRKAEGWKMGVSTRRQEDRWAGHKAGERLSSSSLLVHSLTTRNRKCGVSFGPICLVWTIESISLLSRGCSCICVFRSQGRISRADGMHQRPKHQTTDRFLLSPHEEGPGSQCEAHICSHRRYRCTMTTLHNCDEDACQAHLARGF